MERIGFTKLFLKKLKKINNNSLYNEINLTIDKIYDNAQKGYKELSSFLCNNVNSKLMDGAYRGYKIYKYYASKDSGARVIYAYGNDMNNNYLLCLLNIELEHKKQGQTAKKKIKTDIIDYNREISYELPKKKIKTVFKEYSIKGCPIFLDTEQENCITLNSPCIISGQAGSGKTLVSMRIMLENELKKNENITYITLTDNLKKIVYTDLSLQLGEKLKNSSFYSLTDLIKKYNFASFSDFKIFYEKFIEDKKEEAKYKYTKFSRIYQKYFDSNINDIYQIIRRDIKGRMLTNWDRDINKPLLDKDIFISVMLDDYENLDKTYLEYTYEVALCYQEYLGINNLVDENDIARIDDTKFEKIILDEAQDFTELQIYRFFNMCNNNIILIGDANQIINASLFTASRIKKYLPSIYIRESLLKNYRSSQEVCMFLDELNNLRKNYINSLKQIDEVSIISGVKNNNRLAILNYIGNDIYNDINQFVGKPNCAVIVANDEEKNKLGIFKNVYTINEIKGLEFKYIFIYNICSSYHSKWEYIKEYKAKTKKNSLYRYYFNLLYVAASRAIEQIIFYEESFKFLNEFNLTHKDINHTDFIEILEDIDEDFNDYYDEVIFLEEALQFNEAISKLNSIPKTFNYDISNDLLRLQAKKAYYENESNDYNDLYKIAKKLYEAKEFDLYSLMNIKIDETIYDKKNEILKLEFKGKRIKGFNLKKENYDEIFFNEKYFNRPSCEIINKKISIIDDVKMSYIKISIPLLKYQYRDFREMSKYLNISINKLSNMDLSKIYRKNKEFFVTRLFLLPKLKCDNELYQKKLDELYKLSCELIKNNKILEVLYPSSIDLYKSYKSKFEKDFNKYIEMVVNLFNT